MGTSRPYSSCERGERKLEDGRERDRKDDEQFDFFTRSFDAAVVVVELGGGDVDGEGGADVRHCYSSRG